MNSNLSLDQVGHLVEKFFHRFHVLIFVALSLGGLMAATIMLSGLVNQSGARIDTAAPSITFSQATIDKLSRLQAAGDKVRPEDVPIGKRNPFAE